MKKKIVGYMFKPDIDFGMLGEEYRKGEILVDEEFWKEYVEKRMEFEIMHHQLIHKIWNRKEVRKWLELVI